MPRQGISSSSSSSNSNGIFDNNNSSSSSSGGGGLRLNTENFCFVILWFLFVTITFLSFLIYCGERSPDFLDDIPGLGELFEFLGSRGIVNMLIALIIMLVIAPIPFRLFGSIWVSYSTSEPTVAIPRTLIEDVAKAAEERKIDMHDATRIFNLFRDENVRTCRALIEKKCPQTAEKRDIVTPRSWWSFIILQVVLAASALLASLMSRIVTLDQLIGRGVASATTGMFSIVCLCLAVVVTHGVGGRLKYEDFEFYQPFAGGPLFCTLQAISWILFSISIFAIGLQMFCSIVGYLQITCFSCIEQSLLRGRDEIWVYTSASTLGLIAEVLMILSLFAFRTNRRRTAAAQTMRDAKVGAKTPGVVGNLAAAPYRRHTPLRAVVVVMAWTMLFIKPEMIFFACFYSSMTLLPMLFGVGQTVVVLFWIAASCGYAYTYVGNPSGTGRRNWPAFRAFIQNYFFDPLFEPYFGFRLIRDTPKQFPAESGQKYIFGYHPHGIIPLAAGWCSMTTQWRNQFPGIEPSVLTSSILHNIPLGRDVIQFSGGRDVSWSSFKAALNSIGSVLLIPGGQQEMIGSKSTNKIVTINVKHKGFIRMGLTTGSNLVPMYNFGGSKTFDNLPFPVSWQKWCMSALRANILFLPYGNWLFVPRTGPLTVVVCAPLHKHAPDPTELQVDLMHRRYYSALLEAFEKYKDATGYSDSSLAFSDPKFESLGAEEFERLWKLSEIEASKNAGTKRGGRSRRPRKKRVMNEFAMATGIVVLLFVASHLLTSLVGANRTKLNLPDRA
eukprot:g3593.t1